MTHDSPETTDPHHEPDARAAEAVSRETPVRGPFTLASLLDLNDEDLAEPLSRMAPPEHRWEQFSVGLTPGSDGSESSIMQTGAANRPPVSEQDLIPGLEVPGAVEVPVYLAGRAIHDLLSGAEPAHGAIASDTAQTDAASAMSAPPPLAIRTPPPVTVTTTLVSPTSEEIDDAIWRVLGDEAGGAEPVPIDEAVKAHTPPRIPAIAQVSTGRARRTMDPPAANFAKANKAPVLWPTPRPPIGAIVARAECASCHAPFSGESCAKCGSTESVPMRRRWMKMLGAWFLQNENIVIRSLGALVIAPGDLTAAYVAGQTRRYLHPSLFALAGLIIFAAVSMVGSLRPRPDRSVMIAGERTAEVSAGLSARAPVSLSADSPPDIIRDIASALDFIPVLWLPLMAIGVLIAISAARALERRAGDASVVFTAHFVGWFALWWGLCVPALLLLSRFGFEYAAVVQGVEKIQVLDSGQLEGLSLSWNQMRALVTSGGFHSALLALGLAPWSILAYHRGFSSTWAHAIIGGLLVTAVPIALLLPFA